MPWLPNWITGLRLLLVPIIVWFGLTGQGRLAGAALRSSDSPDGYRRYMSWFKKAFSGRLPDLVTCVIEREGDSWDVSWASDGRVPELSLIHI